MMQRTAVLSSLAWLSCFFLWGVDRDGAQLRAQAQAAAAQTPAAPERPIYRSPVELVCASDGSRIYVSDATADRLVVIDVTRRAVAREVALRGRPLGLAITRDGGKVYVAERDAGSVAVVDTATAQVAERIAAGRWPLAVALTPDETRLLVCDQDAHGVAVVDITTSPAAVLAKIGVAREPCAVAVTADGRTAVVANQLPHGRGTDPDLAACISLLDLQSMQERHRITLPPGSSVVRGVCVSPDGRYAYAVHGLGRFHLPITQLERGWVNTFALSIIDLEQARRLATVLLDDLTQGAADPHGMCLAEDGQRLWITHAGVHEVSVVEIGLLHRLLAGELPQELSELRDGAQANVWVAIQQDPQRIAELENHLTALYIAGAIRRLPSAGTGPRGIALVPGQPLLAVANYYSGTACLLDAETGGLEAEIPLGPLPAPDAVRRGEIIFHDADRAFQRWHSCASCHPNAGRVDGLRWDFLGDGMGNPKDTMSLVWFHKTEPMNRRATLQSARECTRNGLRSTNMLEASDEDVADLFAYLTWIEPEPSPKRMDDGSLSPAAERGRQLFEGRAGCAYCHPAPTFTDGQMHHVATGTGHYEEADGRYDVPSLIEAYRTAPYLHDGRALTLREVLTTCNGEGVHGKVQGLTEAELDDLIEYVESL